MSNIAAFFDVDGTIFRDSLLIEHFKMLIKNNLLSMDVWSNSVKDKFESWSNREGNYDTYMEDLVENYMLGLKDINPSDVYDIAEKVIELKGNRLYRYTRSRIKYHKDNNHKLIIISGSPDFLVSKLAKKLGFDDYKASEYIIKNEAFTGEKIPMWDSNSKNKAILEFTKKYDIDLEKSFAYGDTTGDLSMLSKVGNPIAINPAKKLLNRLMENFELKEKTKIIVERKDVIYTLKLNNIIYDEEEIK